MKSKCEVALACCGLALAACRQPPATPSTTAIPVAAECPSTASDAYFLTRDPFQLLRSDDITSGDVWLLVLQDVRWLARIHATLRVPSLSCGEEQFSEAYRVVGTNAFDPAPVAIGATLTKSVWSLRAARFGKGSDLTTTLDKTRLLSKEEGLALEQEIVESKFWTNWVSDPPRPHTRDGGVWIIEGRRDNRYEVVRRSTRSQRPISELGAMLVRLARLPSTPLVGEPFFRSRIQ